MDSSEEARTGWSFASAREPAVFAAAEEIASPQAEHAYQPSGTLCGIPEEQIVVYRHLFRPNYSNACPRCRVLAEAAPTVPCSQERLHDMVQSAALGPLRTQLLDMLRSGAKISIWINGPASQIAHYAHCDRITEGAEAVLDPLASRDRIGVARIARPAGEFVVVLPQRAPPIIAFAAQQSSS
jgi:hypothetical protein